MLNRNSYFRTTKALAHRINHFSSYKNNCQNYQSLVHVCPCPFPLFFHRPDSSTTVQGDENNNSSPVPRVALPVASPKTPVTRSPPSDFDSSGLKKDDFVAKYNKKRSLLQEVPAKYFSAKKAIMLNFLNGNDRSEKTERQDKSDEESRGRSGDRDDKGNLENQIRLKKGDGENGFKNQYSVLQVRKNLYFPSERWCQVARQAKGSRYPSRWAPAAL